MTDLAHGDLVQLNLLAISRRLYPKCFLDITPTGVVLGFGKGEMTKHCARVAWGRADKEGDLIWSGFLRKAEAAGGDGHD